MLRKTAYVFTLLTLLVLSSCGNTSSSSSDTPSSSENNSSNLTSEQGSMSSENFVTPENEVVTTKLVTYEGPKLLTSSSLIDVTVEGQPIFVYETLVNHLRSFTYSYPTTKAAVVIFDFEGRVDVEITINGEVSITNPILRPLMYGVSAQVEGNKITFSLSYSGNYVLEYNNDPKTAIHIFANPIEKDPVDPENIPEDMVYIGPGIYNAGAIPVASNQTIYIAGGAVVFGQIRTEGLNHVTIRGRGIISGEIFDRTSQNQFTIPLQIRSTDQVLIEGITFLDPAGWTVTLYKSTNIVMDNVKIITARANGDGISVQSSSNVLVKGGFVRSWDDSLVVKNVERGNTYNVVFDGVTVWTDLAQSLEVGYETYGATMDLVEFKNIVIVHNFHKPAMSIHNCDDALITNVSFKNITLEDGQMLGDNQTDGENDFFIDIVIAYNIEWTKSQGVRGNVDGVTFDNIKVLNMADTVISRINGESSASMVKNILFKDIQIEGVGVNNDAQLKLAKNEFTTNMTYQYDADRVVGAIFQLPYKLSLANEQVDYSAVEAVEQDGLIVPEFAWLKGSLPYAGVPATGPFTATATHGVGNVSTTPVDDGTGPNEVNGHVAPNVVDGSRSTSWISKNWTNEEREFAGLTIDFDGVSKKIGQVRLLGLEDNPFSYEMDIQVWARRMKSDNTGPSDKYVRILSSKMYNYSPQSGNAIDILIAAQDYFGIQLRFFRGVGFMAPPAIEIAEVEFYSPSLTYNKPIVDGTTHADVYPLTKLTDGDATGTSYYESATLPAFFVIDMADVYQIQVVVLSLPPSLLWDARTQNIEILVSNSNATYQSGTTSFNSIVAPTDYLFDPISGNMVSINLSSPVAARYLKVIITSNSALGGYGAQLSEVSVYGS